MKLPVAWACARERSFEYSAEGAMVMADGTAFAGRKDRRGRRVGGMGSAAEVYHDLLEVRNRTLNRWKSVAFYLVFPFS